MVDIKKTENNFTDLCSDAYFFITDVFKENDPMSASALKKKKFRKYLKNTFLGGIAPEFEKEAKALEKMSDSDFIAFLKDCADRVKQNGTLKKQQLDKTAKSLSKPVKRAFEKLLETSVMYNEILKAGDDIVIPITDSNAYSQKLILKNAQMLPEKGNPEFIIFEAGSLTGCENEYILTGEAADYETDTYFPFSIRFTGAETETKIFKADRQAFFKGPWESLFFIADEIYSKSGLCGDFFNSREKELLPLISELSCFTPFTGFPERLKTCKIKVFRALVEQLGYTELLGFIDRINAGFEKDNKLVSCVKRFISKLNFQKYEPLWKEIFNKISASQEEYPAKSETVISLDTLNKIRSNIQKSMEEKGYSGTYPDFEKRAAMKKIHLTSSYGKTYLVGKEKNVAYHIHCVEEAFNGYLRIQFLCGTALLKKNETANSVYSCLFNAKGRRLFNDGIELNIEYINENGEKESDNAEDAVGAAVKKAELLKLTKEERKLFDLNIKFKSFPLFLSALIFMGGLFAVLMLLSLALVCSLITLLTAGGEAVIEMMNEIPWGFLFLFSWIGFGVSMGIFEVLANRK